MLVDLSKAGCMITNEEIAPVFEGNKLDECSWNQMFYQSKSGCQSTHRRADVSAASVPAWCGAFSKEYMYKEDQTCAVEQDDNIEAESSQFELAHDGVEVCRVARSRLIDHCSQSVDPTIKTSTKRTKPLCAEKFKQLLQISTQSQSTAGSIPKFTSLMPEMALPFDVFKILA